MGDTGEWFAQPANDLRGRALPETGTAGGVGPESFGRIAALAVDESGRVFVLDNQARELVETHPRPIGYFAWPFPGGFTRDGEFFDVVPQGLVHLTPQGEPVDTVAVPEDETPRVRIARSDGAMMMSMVPPFGPRLHWRCDPAGYLWTAVSDRLHFTRTPLPDASYHFDGRDPS